MGTSLVTNMSRSHSLSSVTTITASSPSAVHSPIPTVLGNHELAVRFKTECGDARIEAYGGDNPQDPQLKELAAPQLPFLPKPNTDPNLVTWNGPDDPANPQNWSFWYKLWLTTVCTLMTLAVYVYSSPSASRLLSLMGFTSG